MQQDAFPKPKDIRNCLKTDASFFVTCAERTVVCGNLEQRTRGLTFLEQSKAELAGMALDRLHAWAVRSKRPDEVAAIEQAKQGFLSNRD
jgi:hypothetical protein